MFSLIFLSIITLIGWLIGKMIAYFIPGDKSDDENITIINKHYTYHNNVHNHLHISEDDLKKINNQ